MSTIYDPGMDFEKVIIKFWGHPNTSIYFASYYHNHFAVASLIFSIVVKEINYNAAKYKPNDLQQLKDFERRCSNDENPITKPEVIKMVHFLQEI